MRRSLEELKIFHLNQKIETHSTYFNEFNEAIIEQDEEDEAFTAPALIINLNKNGHPSTYWPAEDENVARYFFSRIHTGEEDGEVDLVINMKQDGEIRNSIISSKAKED